MAFSIEQPAMALNAVDCPGPPRMWNTWDVQGHYRRIDIVNWTKTVAEGAPGGKLKSIVINCHGSPGYLHLGEGFGSQNTHLFARWKGLVEMIYITSCTIAAENGRAFCAAIAAYTEAYVVASTIIQEAPNTAAGPGQVDFFEGPTLTFDPKGKLVSKMTFPPHTRD
jgi:hypothetical protein